MLLLEWTAAGARPALPEGMLALRFGRVMLAWHRPSLAAALHDAWQRGAWDGFCGAGESFTCPHGPSDEPQPHSSDWRAARSVAWEFGSVCPLLGLKMPGEVEHQVAGQINLVVGQLVFGRLSIVGLIAQAYRAGRDGTL
jgi:hypothetical protein